MYTNLLPSCFEQYLKVQQMDFELLLALFQAREKGLLID